MSFVVDLSNDSDDYQKFDLDEKSAVVAAYEQSQGNFNTDTYPKFEDHKLSREGKRTVACGNFCAIKKEILKNG
jgi:hypothetical protein